ncbi:DUF1127 domain-containing protein [Pelagibacterium limicola]|uniref:DUF1127 domain-containing protein n=1 Tax=Pelagibacterium limicola TaxID=2791022 RepID=UPI0018AFD172|nr:DUF1127 domain-containing protein [Pelagibacterium limicola]
MLYAALAAFRQWRRYRHTLRTLGKLDPRLQEDLGLTDADLATVAAQAAREEALVSIYNLGGARPDDERALWPKGKAQRPQEPSVDGCTRFAAC